jgi:hypothetical protein
MASFGGAMWGCVDEMVRLLLIATANFCELVEQIKSAIGNWQSVRHQSTGNWQ